MTATMLMVIFGAGASYDSCSSFQPDSWPRHNLWHRLPLAKELFLPLDQFRHASQMFARFQPLLPLLEGRENIEEILESIRIKADGDVECGRQLLAVQYYLAELIVRCQTSWAEHTRGASNYKSLLDQVRECSRVCFVTFNYDTLMENAFQGIDVFFPTIKDYVLNPRYSLVKLHGSIDWRTWIPKTTAGVLQNSQPGPADLIRAAPVVGERAIIEKRDSPAPPAAQTELFFFLPALAIPTVSKQRFVCPEEHIRTLREFIPQVTKIVIVGWRAAEQNFLKMLTTGLRHHVSILAASGTADAAEETLGRISAAGIKGDFKAAPGGFSEFVMKRRIEPFLAGMDPMSVSIGATPG